VAADVGARWFILPFLHLTVHGGLHPLPALRVLREPPPGAGGKYQLANGAVFGVDLGAGR
jgi:hypothetical protein